MLHTALPKALKTIRSSIPRNDVCRVLNSGIYINAMIVIVD